MPGLVAKGPILKRLDGLSQAQIIDAYNELISDDDMVGIAEKQKYKVVKKTKEGKHINDQWFGNWWPQHQPLRPVVRRGLLRAFYLAKENEKPLDCYWVCTGDAFQVYCLLSVHQVTVLFLTPPPPTSWYGATFPDPEDIWAIKHTSAGLRPGEDLVTVDPDVQVEKDTIYTARMRSGPFPFAILGG